MGEQNVYELDKEVFVNEVSDVDSLAQEIAYRLSMAKLRGDNLLIQIYSPKIVAKFTEASCYSGYGDPM